MAKELTEQEKLIKKHTKAELADSLVVALDRANQYRAALELERTPPGTPLGTVEKPYTITMSVEVDGYGNWDQAVGLANRMQRYLEVELHRTISVVVKSVVEGVRSD